MLLFVISFYLSFRHLCFYNRFRRLCFDHWGRNFCLGNYFWCWGNYWLNFFFRSFRSFNFCRSGLGNYFRFNFSFYFNFCFRFNFFNFYFVGFSRSSLSHILLHFFLILLNLYIKFCSFFRSLREYHIDFLFRQESRFNPHFVSHFDFIIASHIKLCAIIHSVSHIHEYNHVIN